MTAAIAAPSRPKTSHEPRTDPWFNLMLAYYLGIQFVVPANLLGLTESQTYAMTIGPMIVYTILSLVRMIASRLVVTREVMLLAIFLSIVVLISVFRTDRPTILSIGYMCLVLAVIFQRQVSISASFINLLFLASIPAAFFLYLIGSSSFSVLPSFASITDLSWRVSVLPLISSGGFFALVVFFNNLFYRNAFARSVCLPASAYFLLFSGLRTAIFATALACLYLLLRHFGMLRSAAGRAVFFSLVVGFFTLSVFSSDLLAQLPILSNDFIRSLIVREDNAYGITSLDGQVFTAAIRSFLIETHWHLFMENIWFGAGTFEFRELTTGYGVFDNLTSGSEAYLSGLLARIGLPALLLFYIIFGPHRPFVDGRQDFARSLKLILFLAMITYGSFIVPYDFVFLLIMVGVANGYVDGRVRQAAPRRLAFSSGHQAEPAVRDGASRA